MKRLALLTLLLVTMAACRTKSSRVVQDAGAAVVASATPSAAVVDASRNLAPPSPADVVARWNDAHVKHDARALESLYAPRVVFYGHSLTAKECASRKRTAFAKDPSYTQSVANVSSAGRNDASSLVVVPFTKTSTSKGKSTDYPSTLVLDRAGLIVSESDDVTEANLKNLAAAAAAWCTSNEPDVFDAIPNDKVVAPYKLSSQEVWRRVPDSKYFKGLVAANQGDFLVLDIIQCPTKCDRAAHDCGYTMRVGNHGHPDRFRSWSTGSTSTRSTARFGMTTTPSRSRSRRSDRRGRTGERAPPRNATRAYHADRRASPTVREPMRQFLPFAALIVACSPAGTANLAQAPRAPVPAAVQLTSAEGRTAASSIDAFAASLHGALPKGGNLFYSAASIAIAVGFAERGAAGETKAEMDAVLHLGGAPLASGALESELASSKSPEIAIADRLYFERTLAIDPAFARLAPNENVDFKRDAEGARKNIDAWVSDRTHARIPELLAPGALDADTRFVIANAIYFKGAWAHRFDPHATAAGTFHAASDESVPMMHETLAASLGAHGGAHVLDLPYAGDHGPALAMTIVLPDSTAGLADVEAAYEKEGIAPFVASEAANDEVDITLPKMRLSSSFELAPVLDGMGMHAAFTNHADFSRITRAEPLRISRVIHQAFADVGEEGTEAAAATAVVGVRATAMLGSQRTTFRVDHPFLFFVRDSASGLVLFAGRCVDPA